MKVYIDFYSCFKAKPLSMFYIKKKNRGSAWYKMFCNSGLN